MDEKKVIKSHLAEIESTAREINRQVKVMEVCGGHTNVIMRYGIRELLPENVKLISGPGCPVCVTDQRDIDRVIALAEEGVPVATYGDMLKVPGSAGSLEDAKAQGGKVYEVYSASEALPLAKKHPGLVFFGVGFETTAPMTAYLLKNGVCVYSVHKLIVPALRAITESDNSVDGFLDPGHVSAIIGSKPYLKVKAPQVIAGFTAERLLRALSMLLELIRDGRKTVVNGYPEVVREEGNPIAQRLLAECFKVKESGWRGLGAIPNSGFGVLDSRLDAEVRHKELLVGVPQPKGTKCRCGEVLRGMLEPEGCPLFGKACTPEKPKGACMVSQEGSCAISYRYGR